MQSVPSDMEDIDRTKGVDGVSTSAVPLNAGTTAVKGYKYALQSRKVPMRLRAALTEPEPI